MYVRYADDIAFAIKEGANSEINGKPRVQAIL